MISELDSRTERCLLDMAVEPFSFDTIKAYWRDPEPFERERDEAAREAHAAIDKGMAALNRKQAARWAAEEAALPNNTARLRGCAGDGR
jgi:hypothetical protein